MNPLRRIPPENVIGGVRGERRRPVTLLGTPVGRPIAGRLGSGQPRQTAERPCCDAIFQNEAARPGRHQISFSRLILLISSVWLSRSRWRWRVMNPIPLAPESGAEVGGGRGRRRWRQEGSDKGGATQSRAVCAIMEMCLIIAKV